jgi:alkanesulfonate monooxygenase SsuD/methylene tetrahydromethanopterin reductase-like flavin-dependent oxidoreductase (luciferase family)
LVAKAAVTLDHASRGRAVLGIGAAWFALEHEAHGIEFGRSPGERLDWLEESVAIIKGLMRGETTDAGRHYQFRGARHAPLPYRGAGTLPVMVGGRGLKRTLRIVARLADSWHTVGSVEEIDGQLAALAEHCAAVGRDQGSIDLMFGPQIVIRSNRSTARLAHAAMLARYQLDVPGPDLAWHGPPDYIAERWRPYLDRGFDHLVVSLPAPFDVETIERMAEVVALLR